MKGAHVLPSSILMRAKAIGLGFKRIAELSGVNEDSVHRALKGQTDARLSTIQKIDRAVAVEEDRLRRHLADQSSTAGTAE